MTNSIISVKNLSCSFKKYEREAGFGAAFRSLFKRKFKIVEAVKDISFEVPEGQVLGFIGPNGAGKSTTIKVLTGILYPNKGEVTVLGYHPWKERKDYVKYIGAVIGNKTQLWWDIPALDAFALNKELYEIPKKDYQERLDELLKMLDLKEVSKTPVRKLSLGERMKCEFVASLLHNPKIVFLDEPTIGLDVVAKEKVREFIRKYNKENGTTFFLTTHDMDDIEELCDRIMIIDKGKIIYDGTVEDIRKKYVKTKIIRADFGNAVTRKIRVTNGTVLKQVRHHAEIEISLKDRDSVPAAMKELFKNYDVLDVSVDEPKIEKIIAQIYGESK